MIDLPKVLHVTHLNGHHRRTLASILRHPTAHNVEWHDVLSLLNTIATVTELHSGKIDVELGDDHITLGRTHGKDVSADELRQLRTFLSTAGFDSSDDAEPATDTDQAELSRVELAWVVLVDHRRAKLFALVGSEGAAPLIVSPEDPHGHLRHLEHRREGDHDGGRVAEDDGYYEKIAADLVAAYRRARCRGRGH
jgi:hypothetical protein